MPASRRARATTFAPRSCPSRPGLATSTRILFIDSPRRSSLEDRRLLVLAPHLPERVAHLAERGVGAGGLEDGDHDVVLAPGDLLETSEGRAQPVVVAGGLERGHPGRLLLRHLLVDVEYGVRPFLHHVVVDPDDDLLLPFHRLLELERRLLDLALREALLDRGHHPPEGVDLP